MRSELNDWLSSRWLRREKFYARRCPSWSLAISGEPYDAWPGSEAGVQLLARTTRSVVPTAAGAALLEELNPALEQIEQGLATARSRKERAAGKIRMVLSQAAARLVLSPKLKLFVSAFPEIELDVTSSTEKIDLVAGEYDAGIHLGEFIERDIVAVRVSPDMQLAVVGSPAYFESNKKPRSPKDLKHHAHIALRLRKGAVYRWGSFRKGRVL